MNLKDYIETVGVKAFAELIGINERTVYAWAQGTRTPRPKHVKRIVMKTPVTHAGIYNAENSRTEQAA